MRHLKLYRSYLPDRTPGELGEYKTLERPWRKNERNVSCIPEGTYLVKRDRAGRHQFYCVTSVPGRTSIEVHGGHVPTHSDGCILLGMEFDSEYNLLGSSDALAAFLDDMGDEDFYLTIEAKRVSF